jgi:hypothetical protein
MKFIYSFVERADWYGWPPKFVWRRLLYHLDKKAGYIK